MSQAANWRPTFPEPAPPHWVCFTALAIGVRVTSDERLAIDKRTWLRRWLESHAPEESEVGASYVYLGLALDWSAQEPDGQVSPDSVTGVGSGSDLGEPPGATPSTVGAIWRLAIEAIERGDAA